MRSLAFLATCAFAIVCSEALAAEPPARGSSAAAEVLQNETTFRVDGNGGRLTRRLVIQVNNAEGREHGRHAQSYDSFRTIRRFSGQIIGPDGRRVRRLSRGDIQDWPGTDSGSLYDDFRFRGGEIYHDEYPYKVEWEWEVDYATLLNWPSWYPQPMREEVHSATLTIDIPQGYPLRYRSQWLDLEPDITSNRGRVIYTWSVSLPPRTREPLGPSLRDQMPAVHFASEDFVVDRQPGSLASWQDFGRWYGALAEGRDALPDDAMRDILALVEGVDDRMERAQLVYRYLQRRTRYVSVQLGIGGWQPFDAEYVHLRRYGDCKALTNYLQALLRVAGIESFPALIGNDQPDIDPDFPSNLFNHVVLFVPMGGGEPVWLEATSQHTLFGQLGPGSEGRHALVVTPQGGQLHRTPVSTHDVNLEDRRVQAELQPDGTVVMSVRTVYGGHTAARLRSSFATSSADQRSRWWNSQFGLARSNVHGADTDGLDAPMGSVSLAVDLTAPGYAQAAGRRLFLNPNLTRRDIKVPPPPTGERRQPVQAFRFSFADVDTVRIALPAGARIEVPIEDVLLDEDFGTYHAKLVADGSDLVYTRHFAILRPEMPAEDYARLRDFLAAAARADERQLSILMSE